MAKLLSIFAILVISCLPLSKARSNDETILHFFVHDMAFGPNMTVWPVASNPNITTFDNNLFGLINAVDNLITEEPDAESLKLGRVQGLVTASDFSVFAMTMDLTFYFTAGKYNGSTVSVVGRNQLQNTTREVPVVGGTGAFRFARGYAIVRNYAALADGNGILEYNITVVAGKPY